MDSNSINNQIKETDFSQISAAFKDVDFKMIVQHVQTVIQTKYYCFEGRADGKEFWRYILPVIILSCIPVIGQLIALATLLPTLGITARRLHDTGKSGWFQVISIIPVIGFLIVLFFCIPAGSSEANQYGEAIKE